MIVNPEKFQAITLDKQKYDYSNETIKFGNKTVETIASVRLLGVQLDDKLNYSLHFSNIFKSAPNQLNALIRLNNYLCFEGKKSFGRSLFNVKFHLLSVSIDVNNLLRKLKTYK